MIPGHDELARAIATTADYIVLAGTIHRAPRPARPQRSSVRATSSGRETALLSARLQGALRRTREEPAYASPRRRSARVIMTHPHGWSPSSASQGKHSSVALHDPLRWFVEMNVDGWEIVFFQRCRDRRKSVSGRGKGTDGDGAVDGRARRTTRVVEEEETIHEGG